MMSDNFEDDFEEIDDLPELRELETLEKELNDTLYKVGYDAGYFEGFKAGHESTNTQLENLIFDAAIVEIVEYIRSVDIVDKDMLIAGIETLRHASAGEEKENNLPES